MLSPGASKFTNNTKFEATHIIPDADDIELPNSHNLNHMQMFTSIG